MTRMKMGLGIAMVLVFLLAVGTIAYAQAPATQQPSTPAQTDKERQQHRSPRKLLRWTQRHLR